MPVAIEPGRFGKYKIYHFILQEVKNNLLAAAVQIHDELIKLNSYICKVHLVPKFGQGPKGVESNYLKEKYLSDLR